MEFVLFFLAIAVIIAQNNKIKKLEKRVEALENKTPENPESIDNP
ncbi:MAG: hypothetical protein QM769_08105 [Pseudoxanthomonas sp.]